MPLPARDMFCEQRVEDIVKETPTYEDMKNLIQSGRSSTVAGYLRSLPHGAVVDAAELLGEKASQANIRARVNNVGGRRAGFYVRTVMGRLYIVRLMPEDIPAGVLDVRLNDGAEA